VGAFGWSFACDGGGFVFQQLAVSVSLMPVKHAVEPFCKKVPAFAGTFYSYEAEIMPASNWS
jgi:hypothetical protein